MNVDLADPALYQCGEPEPLWARLRAESPLYRNERPHGAGFWAVLTHDLATQVLKDSTTFGSARGMRLDASPAAIAAAANKMLIVTDPPRHGKIRRIINSAFTPKMVHRLETTMRATAVDAIATAFEQDVCDFTGIAARLPVSVICDMLGVPPEDWDFMLDRTMIAFGSEADPAKQIQAHSDILVYYEDLVRRRRREPRDDIVSALVSGEVDGVPLTDEEIFLNCDGLVSGGNETTRHATVGGLLALLRNPDQWQRLRDTPELIPTAVQEILRYTSPAMHLLRTAAHDTSLAGQHIPAGSQVTVWLPSANRDERVFADPERFDVARSPNRHLTFAQGTHYCLGSALAVRELEVMFSEIVRRVESAELVEPVRRIRSNLIRGFESMRVRCTARR